MACLVVKTQHPGFPAGGWAYGPGEPGQGSGQPTRPLDLVSGVAVRWQILEKKSKDLLDCLAQFLFCFHFKYFVGIKEREEALSLTRASAVSGPLPQASKALGLGTGSGTTREQRPEGTALAAGGHPQLGVLWSVHATPGTTRCGRECASELPKAPAPRASESPVCTVGAALGVRPRTLA